MFNCSALHLNQNTYSSNFLHVLFVLYNLHFRKFAQNKNGVQTLLAFRVFLEYRRPPSAFHCPILPTETIITSLLREKYQLDISDIIIIKFFQSIVDIFQLLACITGSLISQLKSCGKRHLESFIEKVTYTQQNMLPFYN